MTNAYQDLDLRNLPNYSFLEAAHYLGISRYTWWSWFYGRPRRTYRGEQVDKPLLKLPQHEVKGPSFNNLVETHFLTAFLVKLRLPKEEVRWAIADLASEFNLSRPLLYGKMLLNFYNQNNAILRRYIDRVETDE